MSKKVESFIQDKKVVNLCVISLMLIGFHVYQYIDSGFRIEPLTRAIFYFINIVVLFIFGLKALPYTLVPFGIALALQMSFENYSAYILICSAILIKHDKRFTIISFLLYIISVFVVCTMHKKTGIHIAIHFLGCSFFTCIGLLIFESGALFYYKQYKQNYQDIIKKTFGDKKGNISGELDLTTDEYFLLHEIVINCQPLKALGKPNTISKRIQRCYERNGLKNTSELYDKYLKMVESQVKSINVDRINQQESTQSNNKNM